jgi:hypothetical protein
VPRRSAAQETVSPSIDLQKALTMPFFNARSLSCHRWLLKVLAAPLAALALCGHAQAAYPDKPITLIVPFNATSDSRW